MPWLFWPADVTQPRGPATVFSDTFWEKPDGFWREGPGTVVGSERPYFGTLPAPGSSPFQGTDDDWANGLLYSDYLAGDHGTFCAPAILDCAACPKGSWNRLYVVGAGFSDVGPVHWSVLNVTRPLDYLARCTWLSARFSIPGLVGAYHWRLLNRGPQQVLLLERYPSGPGLELWLSTKWDCRRPLTVSFNPPSALPPGLPLTLLISPTPQGDDDMPPPGTVIDFAGAAPPAGYVACDGSVYPQGSPYDKLFAAIGGAWNTFRGQAAPPAGQFRVPLLNGLVCLGTGAAVAAVGPYPATAARSLVDVNGEERHFLLPSEGPAHVHPVVDPGHAHAVSDSGHTHQSPDGSDFLTLGGRDLTNTLGADMGDSGSNTTQNSATGVTINRNVTGVTVAINAPAGAPHNNMQPWAALLKCIKL